MDLAPGVEKENTLREAGFNGDEIAKWQSDTRAELSNAGFSGKEVNEYFGIKEPDMSPIKKVFEENFKAAEAKKAVPSSTSPEAAPQIPLAASGEASHKQQVDTFLEAIEAGWGMSVTGLLTNGKVPDQVLPEDASTFYRIASQVGTLAGDIPAMIAGSAAGAPLGAAAGSAVPVVGTAVGGVVGAGAGAFALPEAIRESLMQGYEKGEIKDFNDFWERASAVFIQTAKGAIIGGATAGIGGQAAKLVGPLASPLVKTAAQTGSEIATMVTVGKGLEGQVPKPQDFVEAGILVGGLHASMAGAAKLRGIYSKTGIPPQQVSQDVLTTPTIKQDMNAVNREVPQAYGDMLSPSAKKPPTEEAVLGPKPEPKTVEPITEPTPAQSAQQKILSQVGEKATPEGKQYGTKEFYRDFVDKLDPINEAVKTLGADPKKIAADENPYILARAANDYKAKTKYSMEKGTLDYKTLAQTGEGLKKILEPFNKDLSGLESYLVSKRALEVEARGLKSGFDIEAAKTVVSEGAKTFEKTAQEIVEFQNRGLEYLRDSGVLSEKSFSAMVEAGKSYVPFRRLIDPETAGSAGGKGSSLKTFKGSEAAIQSPILSILENTETIFKLAEKNRASRSFVELAENTKGQTLIEKVSQSKPIEVKAEEIAKALGTSPDQVEAFNIYRNKDRPLADNEFQIYRDGKREVWKTENVDLAKAIKSLDGDKVASNVFFKLANGLTTLKKFGIAFTPEFIVKNIFRDQLTAGVFSKNGTLSFADMVGALGSLIKKDESYYNWLKSGGAQGTFLELNKGYLERELFKLNKETGFADATFNVLKTPIDWMRVGAELGEKATRLAEFKRATKGASSGTKIFEGGFSSREITVDFSRIGAKLSALNAITAFQNVSIQGLDRTLRAVKEDPAGLALKAGIYVTAPSVLLWWANKDDERYKAIPRWQKDMFWIIPTDDWQRPGDKEKIDLLPDYLKRTNKNGQVEINKGAIYRLPKPQELGIMFGSLPERLLDQFFTDNPRALKDFEETLTNLITPSFVPDAIAPAIEQYFNKSLFTGAPIIPSYVEGILPAYQYTDYTSETAKALGKMVATIPGMNTPGSLASPQVIDNYVRAWSGTLGAYFLQVADKALTASGAVPDPVKPNDTLSDIPFIKAFVVRFPAANAQPIQDFREKFRETSAVLKTVKTLAKQGNSEYQEVLANHSEDLVNLTGVNAAINEMGKAIRLVYKNKDFSPSDKRQMIDGLYYGMIETAKRGLQQYEAIEAAFKLKKKTAGK